jgi:hypothetical protein
MAELSPLATAGALRIDEPETHSGGVLHSRLRARVSRFVVYTHRWLGIALGALFAAWFVSGIVMMYVGMPSLPATERLQHSPVLDFSTATVSPADAARTLDDPLDAIRLSMLDGRPLYRLRAGATVTSIFADDGRPLATLSRDAAVRVARAFAPEGAASVRYDGYLTGPDQWTLEAGRQLPMHRIALGDAGDSRLYVSERSGEVVLKTTAASRRWAYPGAILHWIYLTPIRRHTEVWAQLIIWTSLVGTLMSIVGFAWGIWRYSPKERYRLRRVRSHSPYSGWMWWHHYGGLVFGVFTITWVFSGLLSMDPWDWHPGTSPSAAARLAFAGGPFRAQALSVADLRRALARAAGAREAEVVQSQGDLWLATDRGVVPLTADSTALPLDARAVRRLAESAMPAVNISDIRRLDEYDSYYYDRTRDLPLPAYRVRYSDGVQTWLYVDAVRGAVVRKEERLTRLNRWLYHGLHSLDFPFLYYRRPLWDVAVIVLSLGGLTLALTTIVPVYRRTRRHIRHFSSR